MSPTWTVHEERKKHTAEVFQHRAPSGRIPHAVQGRREVHEAMANEQDLRVLKEELTECFQEEEER